MNTTYCVFLDHFSSIKEVWPKLRVHHQIASLQTTDIRHIKTHPQTGVCCDIEDFRQNGNIQPSALLALAALRAASRSWLAVLSLAMVRVRLLSSVAICCCKLLTVALSKTVVFGAISRVLR